MAFIHSMEELILFLAIGFRVEERASQIIHMNKITEIKEIKEPKEDTIFQVMNASG